MDVIPVPISLGEDAILIDILTELFLNVFLSAVSCCI